jgi:hypothetical protein
MYPRRPVLDYSKATNPISISEETEALIEYMKIIHGGGLHRQTRI